MKITHLSLTNFRAFKQTQTLEFAPVTLLFGPNSVGKSTVLMALAYLQQILSKGHCDPQHLDALGKTNVGGFRSLVYGQDTTQSIILRVDYEVGNSIFEDYESGVQQLAESNGVDCVQIDDLATAIEKCGIELEVAWSEKFSRAYVKNYRVWINDVAVGLLKASEDLKHTRISELNTQHQLLLTQEEKLRVAESLGDNYTHAVILGDLARARLSKREFDSALELLEEKLNVIEFLGDHHSRAVTLGDMARIHSMTGNIDFALENLEEKLNVLKSLDDQRSCAVTLGEIARIRFAKGEVDSAEALQEEKLSVMESLGDHHSRAITLGDLAHIKLFRDEVDLALALQKEKLSIMESLNDQHSGAVALGDLARIHKRKGDYSLSLKLLEEKLSIMESLADQHSRAVTLGEIARIRLKMGGVDFSMILALQKEKLSVMELLGDKRSRAVTLGDIAYIHFVKGDNDRVLKLLEEKLSLLHSIGDQNSHALTRGERARIRFSKGDVESALAMQQEKLKVMESLGDQHAYASTLGDIATIRTKEGKLDSALALLEEQLGIAESLKDSAAIQSILLNISGNRSLKNGRSFSSQAAFLSPPSLEEKTEESLDLMVDLEDSPFTIEESVFSTLPSTKFEEALDELNPNSYTKPDSFDNNREQITFINKISPISVLCSEAGAVPLLGKPFTLSLAGQDVEASSEHFNFMMVQQVLSQSFTLPLDKLLEHLNNNISIGPLRVIPDLDYHANPHPEQSDWSDGSAAWDLLHQNPNKSIETKNLLKKVSNWLSSENKLDTGYSLINYSLDESSCVEDTAHNRLIGNLLKKRHIIFKESSSGIHLSPNQLGTGISQVLPIIVASNIDETELVSVEQPELHIHPRLQTELADLFLNATASKDKVFLIETHSEHIILRMLRRVREAHEQRNSGQESIKHDDISVLYLSPGSDGVVVDRQKITEDGDFVKDWPDGFFDERDEELF